MATKRIGIGNAETICACLRIAKTKMALNHSYMSPSAGNTMNEIEGETLPFVAFLLLPSAFLITF